MLVLDLGVLNRRAHAIKSVEAVAWSALWIGLAAAFAVVVYFWQGQTTSLEFVTGYVLELSLSVDNLFVFLLIFRYFQVPAESQHKVLLWGILGALVVRGIFIAAGVGLVRRFDWILYVFGVLLIYSGVSLFRQKGANINPEKNPVIRLFRRWVPVTKDYEGDKFFVRRAGLHATPLLLVVVFIETTDILFAVDSIPAVLSITLNSFVVFASNVFAILGLRSLYFALAGMMERFEYLHYGLSLLLILVGMKMLVARYWHIPTAVTLAVIATVLLISVVASMMKPSKAAS